MTEIERRLEALLDPESVAEARRLGRAAPAPGPTQQATLLGLFGQLPRPATTKAA